MSNSFVRMQMGKFASRFRFAAIAFALLLATVCPAADAGSPPNAATQTQLFNERDLQGWRPKISCDAMRMTSHEREVLGELAAQDMSVHWQAAFGILQYDGAGKPIETEQRFGPCRLSFQWKCEPCSMSHVGLPGGLSIAIGDSHSDGNNGNNGSRSSGAIYHGCRRIVKPTHCADLPLGEWNQMLIQMHRNQVEVWLNGRRVAISDEFSTEIKGSISLGGGPAPLYFRNVLIEPL